MKPEKDSLHTAPAVLHILRRCRKMLHTPSGVLHKNEAFSDLARRSKGEDGGSIVPAFISLRRGKPFHSAMKHFPFHSKYEAFASLI
ncbi:MAG: hypothetical protein IJV89_07970 [Lentisphaeria bacterium]|nr:hypothetical protein [Lentisphaeria bacterium]